MKDSSLERLKDIVSKGKELEMIAYGVSSEIGVVRPEIVALARKYDKKTVKTWHENNGNSYEKTMKKFGMGSKGTLWYVLNM